MFALVQVASFLTAPGNDLRGLQRVCYFYEMNYISLELYSSSSWESINGTVLRIILLHGSPYLPTLLSPYIASRVFEKEAAITRVIPFSGAL